MQLCSDLCNRKCELVSTSCSLKKLPLVSKTIWSSSSYSWVGETVVSGLEVKQIQAVLWYNPAVLLRIPAKTTPWWDRMILAQTWRETIVGGDVLFLLWEIFPNLWKNVTDSFQWTVGLMGGPVLGTISGGITGTISGFTDNLEVSFGCTV